MWERGAPPAVVAAAQLREGTDMPSRLAAFALAVSVLVATAAGTATAAPPPAGGVIQLAAPSACFANVTDSGCTALTGSTANTLVGTEGIAVSPDGRSVYAANDNGALLTAFARGAGGALTPMKAFSALGANTAVAVSPDGRSVYTTSRSNSSGSGGVFALARDPSSGDLGPINCIGEPGTSGCVTVSTTLGLNNANGVTVSPDGAAVYVAASGGGGALTVHLRNAISGAITEIECLPSTAAPSGRCDGSFPGAFPHLAGAQDVVVSPDGANVYVVGTANLVGFTRVTSGDATGAVVSEITCAGGSAGCVPAPTVSGTTTRLAIAPDGRDVYTVSLNKGLTALRRDPATGLLSANGCYASTAAAGCTQIPVIFGDSGRGITVSPDGHYVYMTVGGFGIATVIAFARDAATGRLTLVNCAAQVALGGCAAANGLNNAEAVAVSPDGRNVYTAAFDGGGSSSQGAVAAFRVEAAPACTGGSASVTAGATVAIPLACADSDGDPLTRTIASGPAHGTLGAVDQAAGTVRYTATAGYAGGDAIVFTGSDGTNGSAPATMAITVTATPSGGGGAKPRAPRSRIAKMAHRVARAKLKGLRGTATDATQVQVSLVRLLGGAKPAATAAAARGKRPRPGCAALSRSGRLVTYKAVKGRCAPRFLPAKGVARWTFTLRRPLPPGTYALTSRAIGKGGHERSFSAKAGNLVTFAVR